MSIEMHDESRPLRSLPGSIKAIFTIPVIVLLLTIAILAADTLLMTGPHPSSDRCRQLQAEAAAFQRENEERMASGLPGASKFLTPEMEACGIR